MSAQPVDDPDSQDLALAALLHLARTRPLTVADLENLDPTVGRVELIDGNLILTPNPDLQHQDLCVAFTNQLNAVAERPAGVYRDQSVRSEQRQADLHPRHRGC